MHEIKTLSNGIRVIAEKIDSLRSVAMGVWIGNGSRNETEEENGISHFIEHMLFKGTQKRQAWQIAKEIDGIGGQINAFTAREYTCFYTKTLDEHASIAMDVLSDMLFRSELSKENMDLERQGILEEIKLYEDSPEDLVYDLLAEAVWGNTSMGRTILGTPSSLGGITSEKMRGYIQKHYTAENMVISVSGNYGPDFFDGLEKYFGQWALAEKAPVLPAAPYQSGNVLVRTKDIEQVQVVASFSGLDVMDDSGAYSLLAFNNIFGSGMSSRLFQNIREKEGLAYSIYAGHSAYIGTGIFDISLGTSPENLEKVCGLICDEIKRVRREKLSAEEVEAAKQQLKGNYILSYESTGARMQGAGRSMLLGKPIYSQEEALARIGQVSVESVAQIIDRVLDPTTLCVAAVGQIETADHLFDALKA